MPKIWAIIYDKYVTNITLIYDKYVILDVWFFIQLFVFGLLWFLFVLVFKQKYFDFLIKKYNKVLFVNLHRSGHIIHYRKL